MPRRRGLVGHRSNADRNVKQRSHAGTNTAEWRLPFGGDMNIEQMIREANHGASHQTLDLEAAVRFAVLVAEECAKVCDIEANEQGELSGEAQTDAARV